MKALRTVLFAVTLPLAAFTLAAFIVVTDTARNTGQGAGLGLILVILLAVLLVLAEQED